MKHCLRTPLACGHNLPRYCESGQLNRINSATSPVFYLVNYHGEGTSIELNTYLNGYRAHSSANALPSQGHIYKAVIAAVCMLHLQADA